MGAALTGGILGLPRRLILRAVVGHLFHSYFHAVPAVNQELREIAYRLRFDVYCRELGWEDPAAFPDEMEIDEYDSESSLVLLHHKQSEDYAGCVRLVHGSTRDPHKPLPFELTCAETLYSEAREVLKSGGRARTGEISRLAVRQKFRRRMGEKAPMGRNPLGRGGGRRRAPPIAMGLYVAAACSGLEAGLDGVFALMEPRLALRLTHYGIQFRQMGDPIEHRGLRAPFYINRQMLFEGIEPKARALLEVITSDLRKGARRA